MDNALLLGQGLYRRKLKDKLNSFLIHYLHETKPDIITKINFSEILKILTKEKYGCTKFAGLVNL